MRSQLEPRQVSEYAQTGELTPHQRSGISTNEGDRPVSSIKFSTVGEATSASAMKVC